MRRTSLWSPSSSHNTKGEQQPWWKKIQKREILGNSGLCYPSGDAPSCTQVLALQTLAMTIASRAGRVAQLAESLPSMHEARLQFPTLSKADIACNSNTWEVEAGESEVQGHLSLYSEFETTLWVVSNNKQTNINKILLEFLSRIFYQNTLGQGFRCVKTNTLMLLFEVASDLLADFELSVLCLGPL